MTRIIGENPRSNSFTPYKELKPEHALPVLTTKDQCDRCSQRAVCVVAAKTGYHLYFCGFHWRERGEAMSHLIVSFRSFGEGGSIVDNRESVDWKKSASKV